MRTKRASKRNTSLEKTEELEQRRIEEAQRGEVRELKYRLLESERAKWEAREQRALDELEQIRRALFGAFTKVITEFECPLPPFYV